MTPITAIKTITNSVNMTSQDVAKELGISSSAYSVFLSGDLKQINRLIKICKICGCELHVTNRRDIDIVLETEQDKANKKTPV